VAALTRICFEKFQHSGEAIANLAVLKKISSDLGAVQFHREGRLGDKAGRQLA
jgi:hypothetical protein